MKIAFVLQALEIGGLPNYVLGAGRALAASNYEVLVAHGSASTPSHLETNDLQFRYLPGLREMASREEAECAVKELADWQPAVIHVHYSKNVEVLEALSRLRIPLFRTHHEYGSVCLRNGRRRWQGDRCQRPLGWTCGAFGCVVSPPAPGHKVPRVLNLPKKLREVKLYRNFTSNIVTSKHMRTTLVVNGFPADSLHIIPYFCQFDDAEPREKASGVPGHDRPLRLLFAGQAIPSKGLELLIAALTKVRSKWTLDVLAEGSRLQAACDLAAKHNIQDRIIFHGWLNQSATQCHYERADLFVMPSTWDEPFGLVSIEAMAHGTPVMAFCVGGVQEYLIDDVTGILVRNVSVDGLVEGLSRALECPDRLMVWGRNGQEMVQTRFTKARHVEMLGRLYRESIEHRVA